MFFGHDLAPHLLGKKLPPESVAQGHRHRSLGVALTDDEAVQLGDDLRRRQIFHDRHVDGGVRRRTSARIGLAHCAVVPRPFRLFLVVHCCFRFRVLTRHRPSDVEPADRLDRCRS